MAPGKMTKAKPSACNSLAGSTGVLPPSTMFAISGVALPISAPMRPSSAALARRLDEQHVGAGLAIKRGARDGALEAFDGDRIGAGDDQRIGDRRANRPPP